jgi:nitroreductase
VELFEGIETKRSFRAFKSTPVPEGIIKRILGVASKSPYYTNTQPWEVAVTSGNRKEGPIKFFMKWQKQTLLQIPT